MININELQNNQEYIQGIINKGFEKTSIDSILELWEEVKTKKQEIDVLRAEKNSSAKLIGKATPDERPTLLENATKLKQELEEKEEVFKKIETEYNTKILEIPVPAHTSVPVGDEDSYEVINTWGDAKTFEEMDATLDHGDYGIDKGWIISDKAVDLSGSRFIYFSGGAVQLEFALVNFAMNKLINLGFTPIITPAMVREEAMYNSGFFPTDKSTAYKLEDDDLYLIGTSEVALNGLHINEILQENSLPLKYCGFSSCFRREAGTYGKDTKGSFRVHQFDKLEMFYYEHPEKSWDTLENIRQIQEEIIQELDLPYRVIACASQDLGAPAAKKYDVEVWLPSEQQYREVSSTSNYLDYTARRGKVRFRDGNEGETSYVHTLNGTAVSISRLMCFLLEHYQNADGSFRVPKVLQQYVGKEVL